METTTDQIDTVNIGSITTAELSRRFSVYDYVVFGGMLLISAIIGVYYGVVDKKKMTTSELLMGGRSMKVIPVSLSILASFMSAITLLGTPAEMYKFGTQYWMIIVGYCFVIPATAYLYIPIFYRMELTSVFEYLSKRFNRNVRSLCSLTFCLQTMLYMSLVLYAPALALAQVTGLNVWLSVASIGIVCTFYTTVGGIKAVVGTDVFQIVLMFITMFVVVFKGASDVGGWEYVWRMNTEGERIEFFNFDPDPTTRHSIWNLAIGGYFTWLAVYAVNQSMIQRYNSIPTMKGAQRAVWINLPGLSILMTVCCAAGLVIYAKYHDCDPIKAGLVMRHDQLMPLFVMDTLGFLPGLPGLFVSGIFSGALSTVSSGMNSLAAVTLEDAVKVYINPNISEIWSTRLTRILAVVYGIIAIALVAVAERLGDVLQAALSLFGMIGGPVLGLFTLGIFFPWANSYGGGFGLVSGLVMAFWVGLGQFTYTPYFPKAPISVEGCLINGTAFITPTPPLPTEEPFIPMGFLYKISYMHFSTVGCLSAIIVGLIVSFLTGPTNPADVPPELICPVFDLMCPYLPAGLRRKLRFGVGYNLQNVISVSEKNPESKLDKNSALHVYTNKSFEPDGDVTHATKF